MISFNLKISTNRLLLFFLLVSLTLISCESRSNKTIANQLQAAQTLIQQHPDSALLILKKINPGNIAGKQNQALYSLLYSQALDKNTIDLTSDSIIRTAVNYYSRRKDFHKKALAYYYLGRIYYNAKEIEPATTSFIDALEAALRTDDQYLCGQIYNSLGNIYFFQNVYNEAIDTYEKAAHCFSEIDKKGSHANMLSYIAKTYYLQGKDSLAIKYFSDAILIYEQIKNEKKIIVQHRCIANLLIKQNQVDSAMVLLRHTYNTYCEGTIPARDYPLWSKIYLKKKELKQARYYALEALATQKENKVKAGILIVLQDIEVADNNYKKAYAYGEEYLKIKRLLDQEKEANFIKEIEARYAREKLTHALHLLHIKHNYLTIIFILITLILIGLGYLVIRKMIEWKRKMETEKNIEINASRKLNESLKEHMEELEAKYNSLKVEKSTSQQEQVFLHAYEARLAGLRDLIDVAYVNHNQPEVFYRKFKEYINAQNKEEDSFDDLYYMANKKCHGLIDYLKEQYPDLSKNDLNYCSMICLGFTTNAIRLMYDHTSSMSIYNRRSKLHSKLGIQNVQLETFLKQLSEELAKK